MSNTTIGSGGSFDLTAPLASGTSIEFLNSPSSTGLLRIETSAYENKTIVASGSTVISTYLGGPIDNFARPATPLSSPILPGPMPSSTMRRAVSPPRRTLRYPRR